MCDIIMAKLDLKVFPHSDVYGKEDLSHLSMFFIKTVREKLYGCNGVATCMFFTKVRYKMVVLLYHKKNPTNNFVHS